MGPPVSTLIWATLFLCFFQGVFFSFLLPASTNLPPVSSPFRPNGTFFQLDKIPFRFRCFPLAFLVSGDRPTIGPLTLFFFTILLDLYSTLISFGEGPCRLFYFFPPLPFSERCLMDFFVFAFLGPLRFLSRFFFP